MPYSAGTRRARVMTSPFENLLSKARHEDTKTRRRDRLSSCLRAFVVAFVLCATPHGASAQAPEAVQWKVDGDERRGILYTPTVRSPEGKAPLVFAFHGHGDNVENF